MTRKFYAIQEMHHVDDAVGLSHHVVARDMMHALLILSRYDFGDAVRFTIVEMNRQQAELLFVRDEDGKRYPLSQAEVGDHYCEEY